MAAYTKNKLQVIIRTKTIFQYFQATRVNAVYSVFFDSRESLNSFASTRNLAKSVTTIISSLHIIFANCTFESKVSALAERSELILRFR